MSDEHKAALAEGREQARVVREYLEALEANRPKRVRRRTPESIANRLTSIEEQLADANGLSRLHLVQERMDLKRELAEIDTDDGDLDELEAAFIEVAAAYGKRRRLSYEAWRAIGLAPRVLKAAGIGRSSSTTTHSRPRSGDLGAGPPGPPGPTLRR